MLILESLNEGCDLPADESSKDGLLRKRTESLRLRNNMPSSRSRKNHFISDAKRYRGLVRTAVQPGKGRRNRKAHCYARVTNHSNGKAWEERWEGSAVWRVTSSRR